MDLHTYQDEDYRGRIERVFYQTIDEEGIKYDKYANVYLPYGYDSEKAYDIFYLVHGGGGNADSWLDCSKIKNALDISFASHRAKPCIVVFPEFYNEASQQQRRKMNGVDRDWTCDRVWFFQQELRKDLLPAVESQFHTFAKDVSEAGLRGSRAHRGIGGFSMGGVTTWFALTENMDLFSEFMPISGDSWAAEPTGGGSSTIKTVELLCEGIKKSGYGREDYRIFAGTGTKDIAYPNLDPQIAEMKKYEEFFTYSDDLTQGNLHYVVHEGAYHSYEEVYHHIYNFLPYMFR